MAGGRLRSTAVALPTVTVLAAGLLTGCHLPGQQRRVCVDPLQKVIDPRQCSQPGGIGRYYYYSGGGGFIGSHVSGGSFTSGGHSSSSSASQVGRGGFGGRAAGG